LDRELGSVSPGKSASMLVIDMDSDNLSGSVDPIASVVDRASPTDIRAVLVDGKLAYGALPTRTD
jgi:cytosine/adenosine deaminase-related metal-dependent hydrolase